jgi:transcriptional regulator GlxA family with amidase domain
MEPVHFARFGFLTLPSYSMIACANAVEALRMANRAVGRPAYEWRMVSLDGAAAMASNGLTLEPTVALEAAGPFDIVFVCGGVDVRQSTGRALATALRRLAAGGAALGGLCTGAFALAEAGLLSGRRCAIHWENLSAIREEFPDIDFIQDLYAVDGDRLTCTGGVAPLDMMISLIGARLGREVAREVSTQFIVERDRAGDERQPASPHLSAARGHKRLESAVRALEADPARKPGEIAVAAGLSTRQLERLFAQHMGQSPSAFALRLRLERARSLLGQTALSVTEVAVACGFTSSAHFSTAYRRLFGQAPSASRQT